MKHIFLDTWGWINLFNRKERHHQQVSQFYRDIRKASVGIVTTDYVLDEVDTMLFKRVPFDTAQTALKTLSQAIEEAYVTLEWITPERFERAQALRRKFQDKPDISFTDLTSMVVMQELDVTEIVTGDRHFTYVGMGFVLRP
jgi:uncharacterized protein